MIEGNKTLSQKFWEKEWNSLNSRENAFYGYCSGNTWDKMAEKYGSNQESQKRDEEIEKTINLLENNGINLKNSRILDIGCGPGYFARAFCKKDADVVCIDVSEKMLERIQKETSQELMKKIQIIHADWKCFDLEKEGFCNKFDLVFANMTPAITTPESLKKMIRASRKWCYFKGWAGERKNLLLEKVFNIISSKKPSPFYGNFIYAWNLIHTMGYFPYTTFTQIKWVERKSVEEWVEFYTLFFQKPEYAPKIRDAISIMEVNGYVENFVTGHVGCMLWSIEK